MPNHTTLRETEAGVLQEIVLFVTRDSNRKLMTADALLLFL
jgi:hypothetical protein